MSESEERRAQGTRRVSFETLVEICGNEPGIPAFEAEALDVSARGLHVRTAYLPEQGAPLVCRFEDRGREIIVEGVVAWRRESARGGEFGLQFTALDSNSVDALGELCGANPKPAPSRVERSNAAPGGGGPGSRVRLHIDGLGSPMKARVRNGGPQQVQVGSNLEFLKVGRHLDIEDLEHGAKRGARIEAVSVAIEPKSQIPELVVVLRYDDALETTPEPSVIDAQVESDEPLHAPERPERAHASSALPNVPMSADEDATPEPEPDEFDEEAEALRGRVGNFATLAGKRVQATGSVIARFGSAAVHGASDFLKGASERARELRKKPVAETAPRRTSAAPPYMTPAEKPRLRPQSSAPRAPSEAPPEGKWTKRRVKQVAAASGTALLLATVGVVAMQKPAQPPGAVSESAPAAAASAPVVAAEPTALKTQPAAAPRSGPVSADVPLFGPTTMATMEPAPLGAPPEAVPSAGAPEADEGPEVVSGKSGAGVEDESFGDSAPAKDKSAKASPNDVEPWGRGKVRTPIVHRLRLDGPGGAIQGAVTPTGFAVVIPERKVMESGAGIAERDKRIARVQTKNIGSGAQITFQFRNGVPGYRVRLRKDYVEFLISAADKSADEDAKKPSHAKADTDKKESSKSSKHARHD